MEILASARRHGITDDDIRHAVDHAIGAVTDDNEPGFVMLIGPDQAANLVEVGLVEADEIEFVVHAMAARAKYLDALGRGEL